MLFAIFGQESGTFRNWSRIFIPALVFVLVSIAVSVTAVKAQPSSSDTDLDCAHCTATEIHRLAALLADAILRDLVCRLSMQNYTPQTLSMALRLPEQEIMRRVATLREWGLVRFTTNDWHEKVIEAVPGKGRATLTRWAEKYCQIASACGAGGHFSPFAGSYNDLSVADSDPLRHIASLLPKSPTLFAAEIGCGTGRYSLLLFQNIPTLKMICGDVSLEMLRETDRYLRSNGQTGFLAKQINPSHPPIPEGALDCIFSFNAFHHFYPEKFLGSVRDALGENGLLFVYTRLKSQNAQSIWGKYFPAFAEKEVRLSELDEIKRWSDCMTGLTLEDTRNFRYEREESLSKLIDQAKNRYLSTFRLYGEAEFSAALNTFEERIKQNFADPTRVRWIDENVMLVFRRTNESVKR